MNLYLRLLLTLFRCWRGQGIHPADTLVTGRRVLPNDLDLNRHMNNGRYLTLLDLSLLEFFARSGFLRAAMRAGHRPMAGGVLITYRRQLNLLQRYEVRFRWICSDEHWNYMAFEFVSQGRLCAAGTIKGAMVSGAGLVATDSYAQLLQGETREAIEMLMQRPLTEAVQLWKSAETSAHSQARNGLLKSNGSNPAD